MMEDLPMTWMMLSEVAAGLLLLIFMTFKNK
ncbi:Hypothetical protein Tcol_3130 [Trichococcus collinsii]|nr:Hypothetical protein Tcol_3130 [Trichococcus collinsii]